MFNSFAPMSNPLLEIQPTFGNRLPFIGPLLEFAGEIQFGALIIVGILIVVGAVTWVAGKLTGANKAQTVGVAGFITGLAGAALIGGAFALVNWGSNQRIIDTGTPPSQTESAPLAPAAPIGAQP